MIGRMIRFLPRRWWSPSAWMTWWSYVHWRLETYGVYYPHNQFNWLAFKSLLRQLPSYDAWLKDLDKTRRI